MLTFNFFNFFVIFSLLKGLDLNIYVLSYLNHILLVLQI